MSELVTGFSDMEEFQPAPEMTYRSLGETDLRVSCIGLGTWPLGGIKWGPADMDTSLETIHEALDRGINLIDTAPVYGRGQSETVLSKVVEERRNEMVIATKAGLKIDSDGSYYTDYSEDSLLDELDQSRERLGTDIIDLYQMHWPPENISVEKAWDVFLDMHRQNKVRAVGICNAPLSLLKKIQSQGKPDSVQIRYNMFQREIGETVLSYCHRKGISVLTCTSLAKGILTGKYEEKPTFEDWDNRENDPLFEESSFGNHLDYTKHLKQLAKEENVPPAGLTLNWTQSRPGVTSALAGARSPAQVKENAFGAGWEISENVLEEIESLQSEKGYIPDETGSEESEGNSGNKS